MSHYATTPGLFPMQGGCACGQIRYQVRLPPLIVHCCHCTACQLRQGSAFALNAVVESENLTLLAPLSTPGIASGNDIDPPIPTSASPAVADLVNAEVPANLRKKEGNGGDEKEKQPIKPLIITVPSCSGVGQHIATCPSCHTGLWSYYADAGDNVGYVRVGTLDRAMSIDPDVHIYTRTQRRSIFTISDGKPQFEGYYPDRAAFYREDCKERVTALEPKVNEWKMGMRAALGM